MAFIHVAPPAPAEAQWVGTDLSVPALAPAPAQLRGRRSVRAHEVGFA